ncbi:thymidylate kinase isoform X1 [Schistocerca americana]|uniref:thymidylate kinase isoform X1 n=2 Tax=Schistocerca americana TaxID=7009 RepID=UPI001F4F3426|nr:thymidylate kinase isoform X1 [Schistocerca americana]XP_049962367.1 thymidylate kinase isoform X1 [Schistocerca serialis cubense]
MRDELKRPSVHEYWFVKFSKMTSITKRGALIVFEGCDRSGKTTQCKKLVENLRNKGITTEFLCFPDRSTAIGKVIDSYLKKEEELPDRTIHLTFAANIWENEPKIKSALQNGVTLVIDRYAYSNVAYSAAKEAMDFKWCTLPGTGLPKPDVVFFLDMNMEAMEKRGGFGSERYETTNFQRSVYNNFKKLIDKSWKVLNADQKKDILHEEILTNALSIIENVKNSEIGYLW